MALKNIYRLFLITIFMIGISSFSYADSGPSIGQTQAISIANNYLNTHGLKYKASTATLMIEIKNRKTGTTKWVTPEQWDNMTGGNKAKPDEDPNFEWEYATNYNEAWKISVVDSQNKGAGTLWINAETGKVFKTYLKSSNDNTATNNTDPSTTNATNVTNQTSQNPPSNNTGIILGIIILIVAIGAGYFMYTRM